MSNHNIVAFRYGSIIKNLLMGEDEEKATDRGAIISGYRKLNASFDKLHIFLIRPALTVLSAIGITGIRRGLRMASTIRDIGTKKPINITSHFR
jgi:hypothetical protein